MGRMGSPLGIIYVRAIFTASPSHIRDKSPVTLFSARFLLCRFGGGLSGGFGVGFGFDLSWFHIIHLLVGLCIGHALPLRKGADSYLIITVSCGTMYIKIWDSRYRA